jgi:hypothetical protein
MSKQEKDRAGTPLYDLPNYVSAVPDRLFIVNDSTHEAYGVEREGDKGEGGDSPTVRITSTCRA